MMHKIRQKANFHLGSDYRGRRRTGLIEDLGLAATQPPTLFLMQLWYSLNLREGSIRDMPSTTLHFMF